MDLLNPSMFSGSLTNGRDDKSKSPKQFKGIVAAASSICRLFIDMRAPLQNQEP